MMLIDFEDFSKPRKFRRSHFIVYSLVTWQIFRDSHVTTSSKKSPINNLDILRNVQPG